jgi:hypothetical protein
MGIGLDLDFNDAPERSGIRPNPGDQLYRQGRG